MPDRKTDLSWPADEPLLGDLAEINRLNQASHDAAARHQRVVKQRRPRRIVAIIVDWMERHSPSTWT
jgi:hypothetical protein